ncbi:outer membrane beta-barrel protein [Sphingomonas fuzhouensis]|uniref:outer membrane beta-barrel protein n=1 Tax=Sphingomonas fuzhouensis TaxID=3106033 RepID=UPI002AFEA64B|nr:outer membrane beta-barrel protein [Sphingomonas sp. SGZ-02]
MFRFWTTGAAVCALTVSAAAEAQVSNAIDTVVPIAFDRGRNESVTERARPETNPVGFKLSGFTLLPTLDTQVGYTDNVYQTTSNKTDDVFLRVAPRLLARSDWSRHSLQLTGGGDFYRYAEASPRNQNGWSIGSVGRFDATSDVALTLALDTARRFESQFSGAALVNVRSVTPYQQSQARLMADARFARVRVVGSADYAKYNFMPVRTLTGFLISQDNRDREVARGALQLEYGLTPDTGLFGQLTYTGTSYDQPLTPTIANRDSREIRALAGVSLDLTALLRGSAGIGYIDRRFTAPIYQNIGGLSFDAKLEYFPSALTTVTFNAFRDIQDSTFGGSGFFNTGAALRFDHELLRNLLLNYAVSYAENDFIGVVGKARVKQVTGGATYLASRLLSGNLSLGYSQRSSENVGLNGPALSEFRALAGVTIHP